MRYGGDEFVVMSKNYTDEKAAAISAGSKEALMNIT